MARCIGLFPQAVPNTIWKVKAVQIRGVALEITERKQAAEEIRRREAQLVEAQRIARLGSYEWDLRHEYGPPLGRALQNLWLASEEFEPTYEGYLARVHPDDRSATKAIIDRPSQNGSPLTSRSGSFGRTGASERFTAKDNWSLDDNQRPIKLVGICQDITERKQVEQQLLRANSALAEELKERTRAEKEIQALTARLITHRRKSERASPANCMTI